MTREPDHSTRRHLTAALFAWQDYGKVDLLETVIRTIALEELHTVADRWCRHVDPDALHDAGMHVVGEAR